MKFKLKHSIILLVLFFLYNMPSYSSDEFPNSIYLGLGGGANLYNGHKEILTSLKYTHTFEYTDPKFFIGAEVEGVFGKHTEVALGLPVGFYANDELKFWFTPAYVIGGEKEITEDGEHFEYGDKFMLSICSGYIFPLEHHRYSIMPFMGGSIVNYEFILTLGVKFGLNFTDDFK